MKETVTVKKSISLYVADVMLEALYCNANDLMQDPEYARRFNYLRQYVNTRLNDGLDGLEVNDINMTFECTPDTPRTCPTTTVNRCDVATTGGEQ